MGQFTPWIGLLLTQKFLWRQKLAKWCSHTGQYKSLKAFWKNLNLLHRKTYVFPHIASAIGVLTSTIGVRLRRFFGFVLTAFPPAEALKTTCTLTCSLANLTHSWRAVPRLSCLSLCQEFMWSWLPLVVPICKWLWMYMYVLLYWYTFKHKERAPLADSQIFWWMADGFILVLFFWEGKGSEEGFFLRFFWSRHCWESSGFSKLNKSHQRIERLNIFLNNRFHYRVQGFPKGDICWVVGWFVFWFQDSMTWNGWIGGFRKDFVTESR